MTPMGDATKSDGVGNPLTPRQQKFVEQYLVDLNATQAAIRAGYSARTANEQGARLLAKASVSRAIASAKEVRAKATGITAERVLLELEALAFSSHTHYQVDDDGRLGLAPDAPEIAHRAISAVKTTIHRHRDGSVTREVEYRSGDKPGAVKLAGRHVAVTGFFEKLEVTGQNGAPLVPDPIARMSSDEQRRALAEIVAGARARVAEQPKRTPGNSAGPPVGEGNDDPAT
jgi:phage terminase small subunit